MQITSQRENLLVAWIYDFNFQILYTYGVDGVSGSNHTIYYF